MLLHNQSLTQELYSHKKGHDYHFDLNKNSPSNSIYFCRRDNEDSYKELAATNFMATLATSPAQQILLFIHGFSNLPEPDIFPRAAKLQALFDQKEKDLVDVVSLIWPCDNDAGIIKDYWDDQKPAAFVLPATFSKHCHSFWGNVWPSKSTHDNLPDNKKPRR